MLDYFTAIAIFFTIMFFTQEWVLEFRLGNLGRFWSVMSAASLFVALVLCTVIMKEFRSQESEFRIELESDWWMNKW